MSDISNKFTDKVIIICPTYERRKVLPILIHQFTYQDYPPDLLQLIILDDSKITNEDIFNNIDIRVRSRIIYLYNKKKRTIGEKRNILNDLAKNFGAKYIVCFDDDDYYPPNRVSYGVLRLKESNYLIGGSSALPIYYPTLNEIYLIGPFINKIYYGHATNGTLIYDVNYLNNNSYNNNDTYNEETVFLRKFKTQLLQLEYFNVMLCIAHSKNTVEKNKLISNGKKLDINLKDIIKDHYLLDFFEKLSD